MSPLIPGNKRTQLSYLLSYELGREQTTLAFDLNQVDPCGKPGHIQLQFIRCLEGDPLDQLNSFFWDSVKLNLPCSPSFDPTIPWICELNGKVYKTPGYLVSLIDNMKVLGYSIEHC